MFCEKCGKEVVLGDAFCWSCGAPIEGVTVEEEEIIESPVTEASATESPVNEVSKPEAPVTETQNMEEPKKETTQNVAPIRISPIYYKSNGVANAFRIIGWFDVILGVVGGILIIISAGSSNTYSMFKGMGAGVGVIAIIAGIISGLGFLGIGEIIQLLQDQKTIMLSNNDLLCKKQYFC